MRKEGWHGTVNWNWNHVGEEVEKQVVEVGVALKNNDIICCQLMNSSVRGGDNSTV